MPSGILCIAKANVIPAPVCELPRELMNVAMPSGKLWMAMANADIIPSFFNAWRPADVFSEAEIMSVAKVLELRDSPVAS